MILPVSNSCSSFEVAAVPRTIRPEEIGEPSKEQSHKQNKNRNNHGPKSSLEALVDVASTLFDQSVAMQRVVQDGHEPAHANPDPPQDTRVLPAQPPRQCPRQNIPPPRSMHGEEDENEDEEKRMRRLPSPTAEAGQESLESREPQKEGRTNESPPAIPTPSPPSSAVVSAVVSVAVSVAVVANDSKTPKQPRSLVEKTRSGRADSQKGGTPGILPGTAPGTVPGTAGTNASVWPSADHPPLVLATPTAAHCCTREGFLSRLRSILDDPCQRYSHLLCWMPDRRKRATASLPKEEDHQQKHATPFTIVCSKTFAKTGAVYRLFGIRKMSSFLRRLNQLGFCRIMDPTDPTNLDVFSKPGFGSLVHGRNASCSSSNGEGSAEASLVADGRGSSSSSSSPSSSCTSWTTCSTPKQDERPSALPAASGNDRKTPPRSILFSSSRLGGAKRRFLQRCRLANACSSTSSNNNKASTDGLALSGSGSMPPSLPPPLSGKNKTTSGDAHGGNKESNDESNSGDQPLAPPVLLRARNETFCESLVSSMPVLQTQTTVSPTYATPPCQSVVRPLVPPKLSLAAEIGTTNPEARGGRNGTDRLPSPRTVRRLRVPSLDHSRSGNRRRRHTSDKRPRAVRIDEDRPPPLEFVAECVRKLMTQQTNEKLCPLSPASTRPTKREERIATGTCRPTAAATKESLRRHLRTTQAPQGRKTHQIPGVEETRQDRETTRAFTEAPAQAISNFHHDAVHNRDRCSNGNRNRDGYDAGRNPRNDPHHRYHGRENHHFVHGMDKVRPEDFTWHFGHGRHRSHHCDPYHRHHRHQYRLHHPLHQHRPWHHHPYPHHRRHYRHHRQQAPPCSFRSLIYRESEQQADQILGQRGQNIGLSHRRGDGSVAIKVESGDGSSPVAHDAGKRPEPAAATIATGKGDFSSRAREEKDPHHAGIVADVELVVRHLQENEARQQLLLLVQPPVAFVETEPPFVRTNSAAAMPGSDSVAKDFAKRNGTRASAQKVFLEGLLREKNRLPALRTELH